MNKYVLEIMLEITEKGKYILDHTNKQQLAKVNTKLHKPEQENKSLINNQRNVTYPIESEIKCIHTIINQIKIVWIYFIFTLMFYKNLLNNISVTLIFPSKSLLSKYTSSFVLFKILS